MILELESYKRDTRLIGKAVDILVLKRQFEETEALYDRENDNFTEHFCRMFNWSITNTDEQPQYVYDRDTKRLYKPKY